MGGSETETSLKRNRQGFDSLGLAPRILRNVANVDPSTTFLGKQIRLPVMLAPIGSLQLVTPDGGLASAQAAAEVGTISFSELCHSARDGRSWRGDECAEGLSAIC